MSQHSNGKSHTQAFSAPDSKAAEKLAKICGLLTSPHDGERAAAALLASQLIAGMGTSWRDVITSAFRVPPAVASGTTRKQEKTSEAKVSRHVSYCNWLLVNKSKLLSDWDVEFLTSLAKKYRQSTLTEKQESMLACIARKHGLEIPE